jgi:hypothetical protein
VISEMAATAASFFESITTSLGCHPHGTAGQRVRAPR